MAISGDTVVAFWHAVRKWRHPGSLVPGVGCLAGGKLDAASQRVWATWDRWFRSLVVACLLYKEAIAFKSS